ncbi:MAG: flagellar hook-basal body complex protein [Pseudomonadota bacterium]
MSVFGSLFTAVSGMQAQSDSISMISNNIANVSTVGFKRMDAAFSSLVTSSGRSTSYSSGSARSVQKARIDQQGILQQSSSGTDIAVSGNGFFIVKSSVTDPLAEPLYTRAGSFSEDSSGVLRNVAGFYLQGWPIDQDGNLPASQADISSLRPVDVAFLGGLTQPTTGAGLSMNLKAGETQSSYPVAAGFSADFVRGIKVYDSLGEGYDLTVNFKKMETPTAIAAGTVDLSGITGLISGTPPFLATDQFSVTVGTVGPTVITLDGSVADMLADINAIVDGSLNPVAYAQLDANGYLTIKATNTGDNITLTDVTNTPLSLLSLGMGASPVAAAAPAAPTLLTPLAGTPNTEGWWTVDFRTPTGAIVNAGAINFTGAGVLNATEDLSNEILISLPNIDWGNGSNLQDIDFDISGFTQFSGEYNVISSTQNGAELGLRTGVSIDADGFVIAQFSNGQSSRIFKLAIATFANSNGLNELTGNVFRESDSSGSFNLREAGRGSAGKIASGALESSNVDLAEEFSKMIVTQRAYSANTKVISTADQMTQELLQLR